VRIERCLPVLTLAVAGLYLYFTEQIGEIGMTLPISGKVFPRLLSAALCIGAVLWFVETLRSEPTPGSSDSNSPTTPKKTDLPNTGDGQGHWWVVAVVVLWTALLYVVFQPLGYVLATTAYLLPLMIYFNRGRWLANVTTAVLFSAGTYYLFAHLLSVPLPAGVLKVS
jgi:putative tricarboxylic transport membrane protein